MKRFSKLPIVHWMAGVLYLFFLFLFIWFVIPFLFNKLERVFLIFFPNVATYEVITSKTDSVKLKLEDSIRNEAQKSDSNRLNNLDKTVNY